MNPTELVVLTMYANMLLNSVGIQDPLQNISAIDKFNRSILKGVIGTNFLTNADITRELPTIPKTHSISIREPKFAPNRSEKIVDLLEESFMVTDF